MPSTPKYSVPRPFEGVIQVCWGEDHCPFLLYVRSCATAETVQKAGITITQNRPMPDLSTIKAVLFDVDGTLTNSDPLHFKAFQDILQEYSYKVRTCSLPHDLQSFRLR